MNELKEALMAIVPNNWALWIIAGGVLVVGVKKAFSIGFAVRELILENENDHTLMSGKISKVSEGLISMRIDVNKNIDKLAEKIDKHEESAKEERRLIHKRINELSEKRKL